MRNVEQQIPKGRSELNFEGIVREQFSFLLARGFSEISSSPTSVSFQQGDLTIDICHGRTSHEVGLDVRYGGVKYNLSEIIRVGNAAAADSYRRVIALSADALSNAVQTLAELLVRYGGRVLSADSSVFAELLVLRERWSVNYALDVAEQQSRPAAEAAFRHGRYREAAELYERILPRLTEVELKKFRIAMKRASDENIKK